jgi:hypothetical protein
VSLSFRFVAHDHFMRMMVVMWQYRYRDKLQVSVAVLVSRNRCGALCFSGCFPTPVDLLRPLTTSFLLFVPNFQPLIDCSSLGFECSLRYSTLYRLYAAIAVTTCRRSRTYWISLRMHYYFCPSSYSKRFLFSCLGLAMAVPPILLIRKIEGPFFCGFVKTAVRQ